MEEANYEDPDGRMPIPGRLSAILYVGQLYSHRYVRSAKCLESEVFRRFWQIGLYLCRRQAAIFSYNTKSRHLDWYWALAGCHIEWYWALAGPHLEWCADILTGKRHWQAVIWSGIGHWQAAIWSGIGHWQAAILSGIGHWQDAILSGIGHWPANILTGEGTVKLPS